MQPLYSSEPCLGASLLHENTETEGGSGAQTGGLKGQDLFTLWRPNFFVSSVQFCCARGIEARSGSALNRVQMQEAEGSEGSHGSSIASINHCFRARRLP